MVYILDQNLKAQCIAEVKACVEMVLNDVVCTLGSVLREPACRLVYMDCTRWVTASAGSPSVNTAVS